MEMTMGSDPVERLLGMGGLKQKEVVCAEGGVAFEWARRSDSKNLSAPNLQLGETGSAG